MNNHDVTVRLTCNVCRDGAQQATRQGVDTAVTHDEEIRIVLRHDGHECFDWRAGTNGREHLGSTVLLRVFNSGREVLLAVSPPRILFESWRRAPAASSSDS